ncbi:unnamed protein product [Ectocarpus sp. 12 AP-2014]
MRGIPLVSQAEKEPPVNLERGRFFFRKYCGLGVCMGGRVDASINRPAKDDGRPKKQGTIFRFLPRTCEVCFSPQPRGRAPPDENPPAKNYARARNTPCCWPSIHRSRTG